MRNPYRPVDIEEPKPGDGLSVGHKWEVAAIVISIIVFAIFSGALPIVGVPTPVSRVLFAFTYLVEPSETTGAMITGYLSVLGWTLSAICVGRFLARRIIEKRKSQ